VKFLITLNMPSGQGYLVHQVTIEHEAQSCDDFWKVLNDEIFIIGRQFYRKKAGPVAEPEWEDRGDIILNTAHIGKVQEFIEYDGGYRNDESRRDTDFSREHPQGSRPPIRPRRGVL
jgi:hypothetical protein